MADLICEMKDCVHRSKMPLRKWNKSGEKCYGCSLEYVMITRIFDADNDIAATAGEENMAHCAYYEPKGAQDDE